jgi:hypothetical protein
MSKPFSYKIRITVANDDGQEDVVFDNVIKVDDEKQLMSGEIPVEWEKASEMSDIRADDGTDWDVDIQCLSVTNDEDGSTDWENDMMPQRDEVSAWLTVELSKMVPGSA